MSSRQVALHRVALQVLSFASLAAFTLLASAMLAPWPILLVGAGAAAALWTMMLRRASRTPAVRLPVWVGSASLLVVALVVVAWSNWPALSGDFVTDDFGCLRLWHSKGVAQIVQLGDISDGIWGAPDDELRPVFALWFKGLLSVFGVRALPLHAANLLLHLLACLTVYAIAGQWWGTADRGSAVGAALLFGTMPVAAEPVAWLIGGVDVLSGLAYLFVVFLFVRFRATGRWGAWVGAVAATVPALFTKEIVVTLPATLLGFDLLVARPGGWGRSDRRRTLLGLLRVHLPFFLATIGFLGLRRLAFDTFAREGRLLERTPWFLSSLPIRLRWFLLPDPVEGTAKLTQAVAAVGGIVACLVWLWRLRDRHGDDVAWIAFFGIGVPVITHLPLVVTYLSPRHLYLPGAALALAAGRAVFPGGRDTEDGKARLLPRLALMLVLLMIFVPALRLGHARWRAAAETSREARLGIAAATVGLPSGTLLVVAGIPDQRDSTLIWRFALPFALQPPFVERDLESSMLLIEPPDLYCCPVANWWKARMPHVAHLLVGDPQERVDIHLVEWRDGGIRLCHGRPRRRLVRGLIEETLGRPLTPDAPGSLDEGKGIVARLVDLARRTRQCR